MIFLGLLCLYPFWSRVCVCVCVCVCVGGDFLTPPRSSLTPAGCPTIQLKYDTTRTQCQAPEIKGSVPQHCRPIPCPLQTPISKPGCSLFFRPAIQMEVPMTPLFEFDSFARAAPRIHRNILLTRLLVHYKKDIKGYKSTAR